MSTQVARQQAEEKMRNLLMDGLNSPVGITLDKAVVTMRALQFKQRYGEWIAEQNRLVESYGIFGEEFRAW